VLEEEEYLRRKEFYQESGQRHYYFMNIGNGEVIDAARKARPPLRMRTPSLLHSHMLHALTAHVPGATLDSAGRLCDRQQSMHAECLQGCSAKGAFFGLLVHGCTANPHKAQGVSSPVHCAQAVRCM
jgi:hypothetical protein